jgi:hypothetical protein
MASKHATECLAYCLRVDNGGGELPRSSRVITVLTKDAKPLIWNEGRDQFMLTCGQHDVVHAPPAIKLVRLNPRPVVATPLQEKP